MTSENNVLLSLFTSYQQEFEILVRKFAKHELGGATKLREACEYALTNGGKRFRPILLMMTAKAANGSVDVGYAALAVELFHTASLVADDLPCMDNDDMRRDKPSLHKVYGEGVALLVTYALIAAG